MTFSLGVLISGGGSTLVNLQQRILAGRLAAQIACVVSSRPDVPGVARARDLGLPTYVVDRKKFKSDEAFSESINAVLARHRVELVVLGGFLVRYLPAEAFSEGCINIHPSLIPAFCGKGFYGMKVHRAVWQKGCKVTGCTVHLVNEHYDQGPIIVQKTVAIDDRDDAPAIQRKVFALECEALPEAIGLFVENRIHFEGTRAIIAPK